MINRTLVRTKIIQTLFAYYKDGDQTKQTAGKALMHRFADTYNLYALLLDFVNELTVYASDQISESSKRAQIMHQEYEPDYRFVENRFAKQIFNNNELRKIMADSHLSWDAGMTAVSTIYKQLMQAPFYQEYMELEEVTYEDDKKVWRKIFTDILPMNAVFASAIEELEIACDAMGWTEDMDLILSYVAKTVRQFKEESNADQPLLKMFDSEEELEFAEKLLSEAIDHHDEYQELIKDNLKNWDADRVAFMDMIILQVALAEICCFPQIALEISMNEYIELAKEYSGEKSHYFINGILDEILKQLRKENKLIKVVKTK